MKKSKPASATGPATEAPLELVGSQQAYEHFRPDAEALVASEVRAFRADASLAYHNVKTGTDALLLLEKRVAVELPTVDLERLRDLSDLALGVAYAVAQVDRGADGSTAVLLAKARDLRDILLASAEALAKSGVIPARAVEKIREGRGAIDSAQNCIDLSALFAKSAKEVKGKTAVTSAQIKSAAEVGAELLKRLRRKGTKRKDSAIVAAAVDARDRIWTLLVQRHQEIRRAGMWLWGDEVDAHVPPLQSRVMPARKKKAVEAPDATPKPASDGGSRRAISPRAAWPRDPSRPRSAARQVRIPSRSARVPRRYRPGSPARSPVRDGEARADWPDEARSVPARARSGRAAAQTSDKASGGRS